MEILHPKSTDTLTQSLSEVAQQTFIRHGEATVRLTVMTPAPIEI
jgi:hypothetical protein